MRMWMIEPRLLCRKHLLGEHGEIHKHRHNFVKQHKMTGRTGQIFPTLMESRHDHLAAEMLRRGYRHESPYSQPDVAYLGAMLEVEPDLDANNADLCARCAQCRENIGLSGTHYANPDL